MLRGVQQDGLPVAAGFWVGIEVGEQALSGAWCVVSGAVGSESQALAW